MTVEQQNDWDDYIPLFLMSYRGAIHATTGYTPAKLLFGRELRLPANLLFGLPGEKQTTASEYVTELRGRLERVHTLARSRIKDSSDLMKTRYDRRANSTGFVEHDLVWLYNTKRRKGRSPKLQKNWEGPYRIVKRINDVVYRIQRGPRTKCKVVHVDRLYRYCREERGTESVRDEQT
uniref:Integrase p58-like C-terminal domain-containing protein n=1 Tax=Biomphalaria glabrata TaxID=6526 RepID=A0A2C9LGT8_BIOGL